MNEFIQGDEMTIKILVILAWQQDITNQGFNYTGEKDWALNKIRALLSEAYNRGVQDSIQTLKDNYGSDGKPALVIIESFDGFNEQRPALEETLDNLNNLIK